MYANLGTDLILGNKLSVVKQCCRFIDKRRAVNVKHTVTFVMFIKGPRSKHLQNAMGRRLEERSHGPVTQRGLRLREKKKALTNQSHSTFWRMMILTLLR